MMGIVTALVAQYVGASMVLGAIGIATARQGNKWLDKQAKKKHPMEWVSKKIKKNPEFKKEVFFTLKTLEQLIEQVAHSLVLEAYELKNPPTDSKTRVWYQLPPILATAFYEEPLLKKRLDYTTSVTAFATNEDKLYVSLNKKEKALFAERYYSEEAFQCAMEFNELTRRLTHLPTEEFANFFALFESQFTTLHLFFANYFYLNQDERLAMKEATELIHNLVFAIGRLHVNDQIEDCLGIGKELSQVVYKRNFPTL